jgi:hypothetical protein
MRRKACSQRDSGFDYFSATLKNFNYPHNLQDKNRGGELRRRFCGSLDEKAF